MSGKRVTMHNGRGSKKNGKFSAYGDRHNDRNYDVTSAENIHEEKTKENFYWHCYQNENPDMSFEEAEKKFYEKHFTNYLNKKNAMYEKNRHKENIKTMDEYRTSYRSCPEETLFYIGNQKESVEPEILKEVVIEFIDWMKTKYKNVKVIDIAMHMDEATPHFHVKQVYISRQGTMHVNQKEALEEMGIQRPNPNKKESRYNNAKMTFTKECRDKFIQICKRNKIEIIEEPKEKGKVGLSQTEYITQELQNQNKALKNEISDKNIELNQKEANLGEIESKITERTELLAEVNRQGKKAVAERDKAIAERDKIKKEIEEMERMRKEGKPVWEISKILYDDYKAYPEEFDRLVNEFSYSKQNRIASYLKDYER